MNRFFIRFWPFILVIIFVVIAITFFNKSASNLSPAGNLTGTWSGTATFKNTEDPGHYCTFSGNLTLQLTQTNNKINGKFTYAMTKGVPFGEGTVCVLSTDTYQISSNLSGSRIENIASLEAYGTFAGSFTTDTITLNQTEIPSLKLIGPINLLRQ